jgi:hypothetical protein
MAGALLLGGISALFLLSYTGAWQTNFGSSPLTLLFALIFGGLCAMFCTRILNTDTWVITDSGLQVKSLLGMTVAVIPLEQIEYWWEVEQFGRYERWYKLTVNAGGKGYSLVSGRYQNFYPLRALITMGKRQDLAAQTRWYERAIRNSAMLGFTFGAFLLCFSSAFLFGIKAMEGEDLTPIIAGGIMLAISGIALFGNSLYTLHFVLDQGEAPKAPPAGLPGFIKHPIQGLKPASLNLAAFYLALALLLCVLAPIAMRHITSH